MLVDGREAATDPVRRTVRDVEVHVRGALDPHLAEDGAGYHVPRGELLLCPKTETEGEEGEERGVREGRKEGRKEGIC